MTGLKEKTHQLTEAEYLGQPNMVIYCLQKPAVQENHAAHMGDILMGISPVVTCSPPGRKHSTENTEAETRYWKGRGKKNSQELSKSSKPEDNQTEGKGAKRGEAENPKPGNQTVIQKSQSENSKLTQQELKLDAISRIYLC